MKRTTSNAQFGAAGESAVTRVFELIGWGVADNCRHDLGTDLLVTARDERRFDLGHVLGVQVKTRGLGSSLGKYFSEPCHDSGSGELRGWWFRDDTSDDVEAWLNHGLRHLLVLHDLNDGASYWVHVTRDAVVPAGAGVKILVPVEQTVDPEHREALLAIAAVSRPRVEWEGSSWAGARGVSKRALLRHALIAPRLVAPHVSKSLDAELGAEEAVALLSLTKVAELGRRLDLGFGDDLDAALDRPPWRWQLARAFHQRLVSGDLSLLERAVNDAETAPDRTAATVMLAAGLIEEGVVDRAELLLAELLGRDDAGPVDHAWVALQHARSLGELGRLGEARQRAVEAQAARLAVPGDLTASAIGGQGAVALFRLTSRGRGDLAAGVSGGDTTASWWRSLTTESGLAGSLETAFKTWGRDRAVTVGARDVANDDLVAARLIAGHLGDHVAWCRLARLHSYELLLRTNRSSDTDEARSALRALRLSGDHKGMKLASRRIVLDGPAEAAVQAVREVDLEALTSTTARASVMLLWRAGDVLDESSAARAIDWLLAVLSEPASFTERTRWTGTSVLVELTSALAALIPAAPADVQGRVASWIIDRLEALGTGDLPSGRWAQLVRSVPAEAWANDAIARSTGLAEEQDDDLRSALYELSTLDVPASRERLIELADTGSQSALVAYGNLRDLPDEAVVREIERLVERCERIREEAERHSFSHTSVDGPRELARLNLLHPARARWDPLLDLLEDGAVWPAAKNGALDLLAVLAHRVADTAPGLVRERLRSAADRAAERSASSPPFLAATLGEFFQGCGPALDLAIALAPVRGGRDYSSHILALLAGSAVDRRWAARIARHGHDPGAVGLLTGLVRDGDPAVRAEAAVSLVLQLARDPDASPLARAALDEGLEDRGTVFARHLVDLLSSFETDEDRIVGSDDLVSRLRSHRSAYVRRRARAATRP